MSNNVRLATVDDLPNILRMGEDFFNASGYKDISSFNKEDTHELLIKLINNGTLLTDGNTSILGFIVFPLFMNTKCLVAQELFWWVDKEARKTGTGIKLLKLAESIAAQQGATAMLMLSLKSLDGDRVNKLYNKLGYSEREQTYMRLL